MIMLMTVPPNQSPEPIPTGRNAVVSLCIEVNARRQSARARRWLTFGRPRDTLDIMKRNQIAWYFWAVGTVLIVLSWFQVVTTTIGWCSFGIGMAGSVMGWGVRPPKSD